MHKISSNHLSIERAIEIANDEKIELSASSKESIEKCKTYLDNKIKTHNQPIYGINTGFGSLCDTIIEPKDLGLLQHNLVVSHACGLGDKTPKEIVKLMLLLKTQGLSYGHSGVDVRTVEQIITLFNNNLLPVIYDQGSLGASGDLAPLAHMSLALIGKGELYQNGTIEKTDDVLKIKDIKPIELQAKEGLALLNGTQFMSSYGVWFANKAKKLSLWADFIAAISIEAFDGRIEPFNPSIHQARAHNGQIETAKNIRTILAGSEIISQEKKHVQDPYSFRCIPQVHGASKDAIEYVSSVIEKEINSVTDNPTIFPDEDLILSAGNFHGQPLALVLDQLAIAMAELGSISERRTYQLISGLRGLPAFLVAEPGINSGFMIPQYTAASIASQNKQLCTPASVDSIVSSNGQEDHVSMGANAATKLYKVVNNVERILAIELLNAVQGLAFRSPLKSSPLIIKMVDEFRQKVPFVKNDVQLNELMLNSVKFIQETNLKI